MSLHYGARKMAIIVCLLKSQWSQCALQGIAIMFGVPIKSRSGQNPILYSEESLLIFAVGVLMAGNIQPVGIFTTWMCVLLGRSINASISWSCFKTTDVLHELVDYAIDWIRCSIWRATLENFQENAWRERYAYIATGSDNFCRYFQFITFGK